MISLFCRRPVAALLLSLSILLLGALALQKLPVSALPQAEFPVIIVQAQLPGASPDIIASAVATPLERALGSISGVNEITSTCQLGSCTIAIQFDLARPIDSAAQDVQAALSAANKLLPAGMPSPPVYRKINPADAPILILSLSSPTQGRAAMYDLASTVLAQKLSRIQGVGQVNVGGGSLPALRADLDPAALYAAGIDAESVRAAVAANNPPTPLGAYSQGPVSLRIASNDQIKTPAQLAQIPLKTDSQGRILRLSAVANARSGSQDERASAFSDGNPAVMLIVFKQPGSNVVETVERIAKAMPELNSQIPASMKLEIRSDTTKSVKASVHEAAKSLWIACALVTLVALAFLRNARAALATAISVPISLFGAIAAMLPLGFSINNLSLMALIVAAGFVVDDAVVVVENICKKIEAGMPPPQAAYAGASEVAFTVVSMSLSLIAVFIPILFMNGIIGRYFFEFSATMAAAILASLAVSLTAVPAFCARFLLPSKATKPRAAFFAAALCAYEKLLAASLRRPKSMAASLAFVLAGSFWLAGLIPKGFFPIQDTGMLMGGAQADQAISFEAMSAKVQAYSKIILEDPDVEHVSATLGSGGGPGSKAGNSASFFVSLKPKSERASGSEQIIARLRPKLAKIAGSQLFLQSSGDMRMGGRSANALFQYTLQADDANLLRKAEIQARALFAALPELADVGTDANDKGSQTLLEYDRDALARAGIAVRQADANLSALYSQRIAGAIFEPMNQYRIVLAAPAQDSDSPGTLALAAASNGSGLAKFADFATWSQASAPLTAAHQSLRPAVTVSFNLAAGKSLSEASAAVENAARSLPAGVSGSFAGQAKFFKDTFSNQPMLIAGALAAIYIVLGILYESLRHPLTILTTIPGAAAGALIALYATGTEFSLIAMIGIILLVGIVKKNAIMLIDRAIDLERSGTPFAESLARASRERIRPILMTTLAAMLGAVPLITGSVADGGEMRAPLGITIIGGLALSQLLSLFTTPALHALVSGPRKTRNAKGQP